MKLAISNIAWPRPEKPAVARVLGELGIAGVEIAPTALWPRPLEATGPEIDAHRRFWKERGIAVVALQALLFGRPDLTLFESPERRVLTLAHLRGMIGLAGRLDAPVLVLGAPRNRRRGELPPGTATAIATRLFAELGREATAQGVTLCIEPNPTDYGCDFVRTSAEGLELVQQVGSPGFGLHLDAAAMTLAGEPIAGAIERCAGAVRHFHVSEPHLAPIGQGGVDHTAFAAALQRAGYPHWISIEMRADPAAPAPAAVRRALELVRAVYVGE